MGTSNLGSPRHSNKIFYFIQSSLGILRLILLFPKIVFKLFIKLKVTSVSGPCQISEQMLKNCADNQEVSYESEFAFDWERADVVPIYKLKKSMELNCRRISLTSVF